MQTDILTPGLLEELYCASCGKAYDAGYTQSYATCCNQPLLARYHLPHCSPAELIDAPVESIWRYHHLLPVQHQKNIVSLGEGMTRIHSLEKLADALSIQQLLLKDEATNPTGSFKARGMSVAISKAKENGIEHCILPTAGNAGTALAAYAAKAGMQATVIMPAHTPHTIQDACRLYGASLILIDGLIDACGRKARELAAQTGAFDFSTMKEPYRLEGKKTMGYEIAEQLNWQLPDVIVYPTGGGTGLIGMWKAFAEMQQMGWIGEKLPRMVVVQSENCNPMIQMFETGIFPETYEAKASAAYGLAVPSPFAKNQIQKVLRESNGMAIEVSEQDIHNTTAELAATQGLLLSPEGSAAFSGLKKLIEKDYIKEEDTVLFLNTGAWHTYR